MALNFEQFVAAAARKLKENPHMAKMPVVYSIDDEGNAYHQVSYTPTIGNWDGQDFDDESKTPNAVCIN
jgi:hypothetical protein